MKHTQETLAKFYTDWAPDMECWYGTSLRSPDGPNLKSEQGSHFLRPKKKKMIDWQPVIDNELLCEFWDETPRDRLSTLVNVKNGNGILFRASTQSGWEHCRISPRPVFWKGGKCPLPEGLKVKVHYRDGDTEVTEEYMGQRWTHKNRGAGFSGDSDIIGYEVLDVAEGWAWHE